MLRRVVPVLVPVACVVYAAVALMGGGARLSAAATALVGGLLWRRHRRARFAAYVFFTVLAVRGALAARWPVLAFAVAAVLVMQTPPAMAAWPRLTPGRGRGPGASDRMRGS